MDQGEAIKLIDAELTRAQEAFPPMWSPYEGLGIIREELDELWEEIRAKHGKRDVDAMRNEAVQLGAMLKRFAYDCWGRDLTTNGDSIDYPDPFVSPHEGGICLQHCFQQLCWPDLEEHRMERMRNFLGATEGEYGMVVFLALVINFIRDCCGEESGQR